MIMTVSNFREPHPPQSFKFLHDGELYLVRPEKRGKKLYWYMRKQVNGKTRPVYLGGMGQLNLEMLQNAAIQIQYVGRMQEERI